MKNHAVGWCVHVFCLLIRELSSIAWWAIAQQVVLLCSNRRDLWWGTDMTGAGARRAAWNAALLSAGVVPAYLRLLTAIAEVLSGLCLMPAEMHPDSMLKFWMVCLLSYTFSCFRLCLVCCVCFLECIEDGIQIRAVRMMRTP